MDNFVYELMSHTHFKGENCRNEFKKYRDRLIELVEHEKENAQLREVLHDVIIEITKMQDKNCSLKQRLNAIYGAKELRSNSQTDTVPTDELQSHIDKCFNPPITCVNGKPACAGVEQIMFENETLKSKNKSLEITNENYSNAIKSYKHTFMQYAITLKEKDEKIKQLESKIFTLLYENDNKNYVVQAYERGEEKYKKDVEQLNLQLGIYKCSINSYDKRSEKELQELKTNMKYYKK
jgi:hypothetical protein